MAKYKYLLVALLLLSGCGAMAPVAGTLSNYEEMQSGGYQQPSYNTNYQLLLEQEQVNELQRLNSQQYLQNSQENWQRQWAPQQPAYDPTFPVSGGMSTFEPY